MARDGARNHPNTRPELANLARLAWRSSENVIVFAVGRDAERLGQRLPRDAPVLRDQAEEFLGSFLGAVMDDHVPSSERLPSHGRQEEAALAVVAQVDVGPRLQRARHA